MEWTAGSSVEPTKSMALWSAAEVPLDSVSTYNAHYQPWRPSRPQTCKPKHQTPIEVFQFNARSTAQDAYQGWDIDHRRASCKPVHKMLESLSLDASTTHRDAFQSFLPAKRASFKPVHKGMEQTVFSGRSTTQDSFLAHPNHRPPLPCLPAEKLGDGTRFEAISTATASYQAWPISRRVAAKKPPGTLSLRWENVPPTGSTVHRDSYREMSLPPGAKAAIGVQVVGGEFFKMIAKGTPAPVEKKAMFTTTVSNQNEVEIVVIASGAQDPSRGLEIGRFTLGGIAPGKAGLAMLEVTLILAADNSLRVTATDRQAFRSVSLNIRDKLKKASF